MEMSYRWEIIPDEGESIFVLTATDSVLAAALVYEENFACFKSVYGIRKAAEIKEFEEAI